MYSFGFAKLEGPRCWGWGVGGGGGGGGGSRGLEDRGLLMTECVNCVFKIRMGGGGEYAYDLDGHFGEICFMHYKTYDLKGGLHDAISWYN